MNCMEILRRGQHAPPQVNMLLTGRRLVLGSGDVKVSAIDGKHIVLSRNPRNAQRVEIGAGAKFGQLLFLLLVGHIEASPFVLEA